MIMLSIALSSRLRKKAWGGTGRPSPPEAVRRRPESGTLREFMLDVVSENGFHVEFGARESCRFVMRGFGKRSEEEGREVRGREEER